MNIQKYARLTLLRREEMALEVIENWLSQAHVRGVGQDRGALGGAPQDPGVCRFMTDRSSRPDRSPRAAAPDLVERIVRLGRQRWTSQHNAREVVFRPQLSRLKDMEIAEPVRR